MGALQDLYELMYDFDAAADAAASWPESSINLTRQQMIDVLKQSLEDIEELEDSYQDDKLLEPLDQMIEWLKATIKAFEGTDDPPSPRPDNGDSRLFKMRFLAKIHPQDDLDEWFDHLENLDRYLYDTIRALDKNPPDTDKASEWLKLVVSAKHAFLKWARGEVQSDPMPPDQGEGDLPRPPDVG